MRTIEQQLKECIPQWTALFKSLKHTIGDEYRASDCPDDNAPGMMVTIGFTPESEDKDYSWSYQTGDNSYTGGAYGHPHWAVVSLYRRSKSKELAEDCADQIGEFDWPIAPAARYAEASPTDNPTGMSASDRRELGRQGICAMD